ncbi:MAG: LapA family protein [Rhodospirillales bacterium]|nr:LapA family protein [Rhodospirillales bacterium]
MLKALFWIVEALLVVLIVVFSVNNQTELTLDLWPLDMVTVPLPIFSIMLGTLFVGFLAGGFVAWASAGKVRKRARSEAGRADRAERQVAEVEEKLQRLQSEADAFRDSTPRLPGA